MEREKTLVAILAGGQATRMGGVDKSLLRLGGRTLMDRMIATLRPQCGALIVNANGDAARFAEYGLPVVTDTVPENPGPLAGILAALEWTALHRPDMEWVVSVPGDTPFLPDDLVERLHPACIEGNAMAACATSGGRVHPTIGLWPVNLAADLRYALTIENVRAVRDWLSRHRVAYVDWPVEPFDPFFNINTPEDVAIAATLGAQHD